MGVVGGGDAVVGRGGGEWARARLDPASFPPVSPGLEGTRVVLKVYLMILHYNCTSIILP